MPRISGCRHIDTPNIPNSLHPSIVHLGQRTPSIHNCTEPGSYVVLATLILRKIIQIVATRLMSDFKDKMHQILFRLGCVGVPPKPRWAAYSSPPGSLAGGPTSKGSGREGEGKGGEGRAGERGWRKWNGKEKGGGIISPAVSVFTVRRYALHGLCDRNSVRLSVCPSVRLSHSCTVFTWFDLRS